MVSREHRRAFLFVEKNNLITKLNEKNSNAIAELESTNDDNHKIEIIDGMLENQLEYIASEHVHKVVFEMCKDGVGSKTYDKGKEFAMSAVVSGAICANSIMFSMEKLLDKDSLKGLDSALSYAETVCLKNQRQPEP